MQVRAASRAECITADTGWQLRTLQHHRLVVVQQLPSFELCLAESHLHLQDILVRAGHLMPVCPSQHAQVKIPSHTWQASISSTPPPSSCSATAATREMSSR